MSGGPAITAVGAETLVTPAVTARLFQAWRIGSASVQYARTLGVAGGFGGPTEVQTASGVLTLPAWRPGAVFVFAPAYSIAKSVSRRQGANIDVKAFTLPLAVTYQIARYTSVFAGYTFFEQRTGASSSTQLGVDQNRVRFGLQFGYPFNFD